MFIVNVIFKIPESHNVSLLILHQTRSLKMLSTQS